MKNIDDEVQATNDKELDNLFKKMYNYNASIYTGRGIDVHYEACAG